MRRRSHVERRDVPRRQTCTRAHTQKMFPGRDRLYRSVTSLRCGAVLLRRRCSRCLGTTSACAPDDHCDGKEGSRALRAGTTTARRRLLRIERRGAPTRATTVAGRRRTRPVLARVVASVSDADAGASRKGFGRTECATKKLRSDRFCLIPLRWGYKTRAERCGIKLRIQLLSNSFGLYLHAPTFKSKGKIKLYIVRL
jgi:hypothetical protein